jgi:hypothetical protein
MIQKAQIKSGRGVVLIWSWIVLLASLFLFSRALKTKAQPPCDIMRLSHIFSFEPSGSNSLYQCLNVWIALQSCRPTSSKSWEIIKLITGYFVRPLRQLTNWHNFPVGFDQRTLIRNCKIRWWQKSLLGPPQIILWLRLRICFLKQSSCSNKPLRVANLACVDK